MAGISIRRMTESDLDMVSRIEDQIFSDPWSLNAFKTDLNNEMAFPMVAVLENKIIGYTNIYIVAGEVQIGNFAVSPGFRKQGVGKRLMDEILGKAHQNKCHSIFLEVRESNEPAMDLYKSFGFAVTGKRKNYYSNPKENAIIMAKEL